MKKVLTFLMLFLCFAELYSYESFTSRIGNQIDLEEREYFGLFPYVEGFQSAEFTQVAADSGFFVVKSLVNGQSSTKDYNIKKDELKWLSRFVNDFESIFTINNAKRYKHFDSINFYQLGKTFIRTEYNDWEFDNRTFYLNGGEKVDAAVIWCDSLNILVSKSDTLLNWRDLSDLRLINSKDIEHIASVIPYYWVMSKESVFQWHRKTNWFTMFRAGEKKICKELQKYIDSISGQLQTVVPIKLTKTGEPAPLSEIRDLTNYFSIEVNSNLQSTSAIEGTGHIYFVRKNNTRANHIWENYHSLNEAANPTILGLNIHYRFNKHFGLSAGVKISGTPDKSVDSVDGFFVFNSLKSKAVMYDLSIRKYFLWESENKLEFFNRFEAGLYAGVVYSQVDVEANMRKIYCYPDIFDSVSFKDKYSGFGAKFGAFALLHVFDQLSLSAAAEYYVNHSLDISDYNTKPIDSKYEHQYIELGMENQKINPNRFFISLGLVLNIRW